VEWRGVVPSHENFLSIQGRHHMPTPLLPEVVPEIDANPVSFYSDRGGTMGGRSWFEE